MGCINFQISGLEFGKISLLPGLQMWNIGVHSPFFGFKLLASCIHVFLIDSVMETEAWIHKLLFICIFTTLSLISSLLKAISEGLDDLSRFLLFVVFRSSMHNKSGTLFSLPQLTNLQCKESSRIDWMCQVLSLKKKMQQNKETHLWWCFSKSLSSFLHSSSHEIKMNKRFCHYFTLQSTLTCAWHELRCDEFTSAAHMAPSFCSSHLQTTFFASLKVRCSPAAKAAETLSGMGILTY